MQFTDQNFKNEVEQGKGLVLVDFFAVWCGPCRAMAPIIDELIDNYKDQENIKIGKLDIDQNPETAQKYNIMSIPALILFKNGEIIKQIIGMQDKGALKDLIERNIYKSTKM